MGFPEFPPVLKSHWRVSEGSYQEKHKGQMLGCRTGCHKHGGVTDCFTTTLGGTNNRCNLQQQRPSATAFTTRRATPSRTGCDHFEFRTSGNTPWRTQTQLVQL